MTDTSPTAAPGRLERLERLHAWLALLPVLALTGPLLTGVPTRASAGAGWLALAAIPAAALLLLRRPALSITGLPLYLVPLLIAGIHVSFNGPTDTFAADRALIGGAAQLVLLLCGASFGAAGRRILVRGAIAATALWVIGAVIRLWQHPTLGLAGTLENTGDLAAAALPGALCALALGGGGALTAVAMILFVVYVGAVPVHAAHLSFLLVTVSWIIAGPTAPRLKHALPAVLIGLLTVAGGVSYKLARGAVEIEESSNTRISAPAPGELGGLGFRYMTWRRVPGMVMARPLIGAGPGQFEAAFPPFRDPVELELSSHQRTAPYETQVESAHNDWLEAFSESGIIGGSAWLVFLLIAATRALRALRGDDEELAALGAGTLGLLIVAGSVSALRTAPASLALGGLFLGALLTRNTEPAPGTRRARWLAAAAGAWLLAQAPEALAHLRHGLALKPLSSSALVEVDGTVQHEADAFERAISAALRQRSDSTLALAELARIARVLQLENAEARAAQVWRRIVELQPHRYDGWSQLGIFAARAGEFDEARACFERAAQVDALHPGLLENRVQVELEAGSRDQVLEAATRLLERDPPLADALARLAARALLAGRPEVGRALFAQAGGGVLATGEQAFAAAADVEAGRQLPELEPGTRGQLSAGLEALAHQSWAREHAESDDADTARRSYRQAVRASRDATGREATALRLELAASLALCGDEAAARELLGATEVSAVQWSELPAWAGEVLFGLRE